MPRPHTLSVGRVVQRKAITRFVMTHSPQTESTRLRIILGGVLSVFTHALHSVVIASLLIIVAGLVVSAALPPSSLHRITRPQDFRPE
jgi:hypothetical protein